MTEKTFIFVEKVFVTVRALFVFQFRMAYPAAVFVTPVFLAPQAPLVAFGRIADKAGLTLHLVCMHYNRRCMVGMLIYVLTFLRSTGCNEHGQGKCSSGRYRSPAQRIYQLCVAHNSLSTIEFIAVNFLVFSFLIRRALLRRRAAAAVAPRDTQTASLHALYRLRSDPAVPLHIQIGGFLYAIAESRHSVDWTS
jgi:hypothetical protein